MNKQAELTRWTPKRLLSLLMALIMTLSLLPTAAFAAFGNGETNTIDASKVATGDTPNHVADGPIIDEDSTKLWHLEYTIDKNAVANPNEQVTVTALAKLNSGIDSAELTEVSISFGNQTTYNQNKSKSDLSIVGYPVVGIDGSADFTLGLKYTVNEETHTKSVHVVIKNLWTGYNVTYTQGASETFTGVPAGNTAKTVAKDANNSDYTQEYTIPDDAKASKDGYTFEGWIVTGGGSLPAGVVPSGTMIDGITNDITLKANLVKNQEISFDPVYSGVSGLPYLLKATSTGSTYNIPYTPQLANYTFNGWSVTGGNAQIDPTDPSKVIDISAPITLTPKWVPADGSTPAGSHKVTFLAGAANVYIPFANTTELVENGKDYTIPAGVPTREGYTFTGWKAGTTTYQPGNKIQNVTGDVTLEAQWARKQVRVVITKETDDVAVLPSTFTGTVGKTASFNVTVPAKYDAAKMIVLAGTTHGEHKYLVPESQHIDDNGNITFYYQFTVTEGMFAQDPDTGVQTLPVHVGAVTEKTFNVTLPTGAGFDAKFTNPASDGKLTTVDYGGNVSFTVKARPGYTVEGVYANGVKLDPDTSTTDTYTIKNIKSNQAVMVDMAAVQFHTVTYVLDGAQMTAQSVAEGSKATSLSAPDKTGYKWDGYWYTDKTYNTKFDFTTEKITKDTVLYGRYTPDKVTISYDVLPGETTAKTYGLAATLTETIPVKDGHTFLGWSESDTATAASYLPGATFSKEIDHNITLYAVWQKNTYTITFSSGEGYSLHSIGSMTVAHGENFEFNLFVDPAYAQNTPTVYVNTGSINATHPKLISTSDAPTGDGAKVYLYRLENVKANTAINAEVTTNATYTVTFMTNGTTYQTQQVEFNHKATQPVDPKVEGFTFGGWYKNTGWTDADKWDFATPITGDTTIYAKLDPIYPEITWPTTAEQVGYTMKVEYTAPSVTTATATELTTNPGTVPYNSVVTFTIKILEGYDASKMQVGINGVQLAPKSKSEDGKTYTFEFTAKENTNITVVGVERKTVTIIYNDNGGYGGPVQETVNYFLPSDVHNGKISTTVPKREGYDFLGWAKANDADAPEYSNPAKTTAPVTKDVADFTSDTVLYAVWQAKETGITLEVSNTIDDTATLKAQYEGEDVTLTATITSGTASVTTGSVQFYRSTDGGTKWTLLDSKVVSGGTATYKAETSGFVYGGTNTDTYKAVFIPTEGNGYTKITSATKAVTVKSTAISWKLDATPAIGTNANVLTIKDKDDHTVTAMVAGQVYTLELPAIYALDEQGTPLTVNKDYSVTWQYRDANGVWTDYTNSGSGDTTKVDAAYSQYVFRAVVTPVTGATSHFTKAAKYAADGALVNDQYETVLISELTTAVDLQKTTTELAITGADNEENDVYINGTQPFNATAGSHLAQFEGQKVTLTATVKDTTTGTPAVTTGEVNFYRKGATADTLLNASPIAVGTNGVATCEVEISKWTGGNVTENKDEFYAVYLANATYDTSASWTAAAAGSTATGELKAVYIKSTAIQTPIIESKLEGKLNDTSNTVEDNTYYDYNLTGLLAGVEHTFTLRQTGAAATADNQFSVVAKDGRTVAAKNYTIQWITKTGDNEIVSSVTGSEFKTSDNKVGDEIYVRLNPTGDMKTGADSKKAIIDKKQDVTVTVEASDEIASTPVDRAAKKFPDVYQLNEIELTATVKGHDSETMTPTGTVKFYYKDKQVNPNTFVYLGEAALAKGTDGKMHASIKTDKLPVDKDNNTKLDVVVCAAYFGDDTFAASKNVSATTGNIASAGSTIYVTYDTVTVYSSVVFAGDSENKATTTPSTDGITITANGKLKANESSVTLTLGQVYTLDHPIDLSKLTYNTDYTVQWQILENALQHQDSGSTGSYAATDKWKDLSGETGTSYTGMMEQDAAYRAKITVKDTPIAKGSFTKVDQAIKGRDVYYSNVLVVGVGMATVTTNITTSANQNFNEEGIVSGETATIHVLASGAAKTTPISTVTATITNGASETVFNEKANNVNGYTSFAWDTAGLTPGYYTLTVTAESNNGYAPQTITRTLIVRDNAYTLKATKESKVYNGKAQGIDWELTGVDIENALAQKSVVVYYYDKDGKMVEPTQAGKYQYDLYLPASAYWTELEHVSGTFTIEKRPVEVVDLVAQAKVYDGTNNANIQEIILNDSAVDSDGTATGDKGIIDGDSVYAVGTGYTSKDTAGTDATLGVKDVSLKGDDAANYTLSASGYTEVFNIQRSQVKGAIVSGRTYKYTGKDIKLAASDIYLIDQAGNQLTNYDVTYYYHNGDGVEKVDAMNKMGKYTVIARPEQNNYKGGATATVYVGTADNAGTLDKNAVSSLITISNTVELYGATNGVTVSATKGTATASYYYNNGTSADWHTDVPANAGRYLVKVTTSTGDTAYGLYTVVKARPALTLTATGATYNSAQYNGAPTGTYNNDPALPAGTYYTYTGGTIQGVAYEAPTEAGDYVVTAHVGKTPNYTAHEISTNFTIAKAALTIKADDLQRWQYGAYPDMVATYTGLATDGIAADTSLRDVQIQPEFLFNEKDGGYTNHAYDQVGTYPVTVRNALARNYTVTYKDGKIATTAEEPKAKLAIHGMPDNGTATENLVYYGDTIQLYAYGYYKTLNGDGQGSYNTSSLIEWSVSDASIAEIDQSGLLTIKGVGTFTVTLTRGSGSAAISTTIKVEAKPKEVSIDVPDVDKVYTASEQIYDSTPTVNGLINSDSVTPTVTAGTNKRTVVGSQITSYTVNDAKYVSETYGGLFTINVKDVDIKPTAANTTYGTLATGLTYTEVTPASSDKVLADDKTVSVADAYGNLDVYNGYEILVAGKEDSNYNVHYQTKNDREVVGDVNVKELTLTISTGTLKDQIGMTSGSLNPMGKYPVNGAAIDDPAPAMGPSNVRMYGEPNWVMDEELPTLISGDTLADLAALGDKLVKFNYNIGADANVEYNARTTFLSGKNKYDVETNDSMMAFKNYTETYMLGTQNIYQRPVTLSVPSGMTLTAYKPSILDSSNQVKNDVLLNLLLNNLIVSKYNNEGGLAELLKHTIKDLGIQIKSTQVTGDKLTVKIALGNQNYWLDPASSTIEIELVSTKIVPVYSPLDWTSFTVTMYNETKTAPVAISGNVRFFIFQKKDGVELKYSNYKNDTIIRSDLMESTGRTGEFRATFSRLPAGDYAIFAIAENYTIVE